LAPPDNGPFLRGATCMGGNCAFCAGEGGDAPDGSVLPRFRPSRLDPLSELFLADDCDAL